MTPIDENESPSPSAALRDDRLRATGQAALMLLEAVLLTLIDRGVVAADDVVEAIETTVAAKRNAMESEPENVAAMSIGLLATIANSIASRSVRSSP